MATYSSIFAWRIPMDRRVWWATVHGIAKGRTKLSDNTTFLSASLFLIILHSCLPVSKTVSWIFSMGSI